MRLFDKVAIIGVGLIGGSLGLAIKKKGLARLVIGVSRHKATLVLAKKCRAIDLGSQDINVVKDADLVILATPVHKILQIAQALSHIVKPECVVTDVGSTKKEIVLKLHKLFSRYVGSHPLAGSEKRGMANARGHIFQNSLCILTPLKSTHKQSLQKIVRLWKILGAKVVYVPPALHDHILSFVSHLPHVVAFSLVETVPRPYLRFAASGLRDTTRIAASDNRLWEDIILSNKNNVLKAIDLFQKNLTAIKSAVKKENRKSLGRILKKAKITRESLD